jgi:hypothetical protein
MPTTGGVAALRSPRRRFDLHAGLDGPDHGESPRASELLDRDGIATRRYHLFAADCVWATSDGRDRAVRAAAPLANHLRPAGRYTLQPLGALRHDRHGDPPGQLHESRGPPLRGPSALPSAGDRRLADQHADSGTDLDANTIAFSHAIALRDTDDRASHLDPDAHRVHHADANLNADRHAAHHRHGDAPDANPRNADADTFAHANRHDLPHAHAHARHPDAVTYAHAHTNAHPHLLADSYSIDADPDAHADRHTLSNTDVHAVGNALKLTDENVGISADPLAPPAHTPDGVPIGDPSIASGDAHLDRDSDCNGHRIPDGDSNRHSHADADDNPYGDVHTDAYAYGDTDVHPNAHACRHSDGDARSNRDHPAISNIDADPPTNPDTDATSAAAPHNNTIIPSDHAADAGDTRSSHAGRFLGWARSFRR